jgi:hypothetical protein
VVSRSQKPPIDEMPLWRIFAHPDTFSVEQRKNLSTAVTKLYRDLPDFYVVVIFVDVKEEQVWVGGESKGNFVRIVVEQIARQLPPSDTAEGQRIRPLWMNMINDVSKRKTMQPRALADLERDPQALHPRPRRA